MRIVYRLTAGLGERDEVFDDGDEQIKLSFIPSIDGYLFIGEKMYRVKNGSIILYPKNFTTGTCRMRLEADGGVYNLEPVERIGASIRIPKTEDEVIRKMMKKLIILEGRCLSMNKRIEALEVLCNGHHIFDFERTHINEEAN